MNPFTVALASGALILAGAGTAVAQKPPKPPKPPASPNQQGVTFKASAGPIRFGASVVLDGDVKGAKAGVPVTLQRQAAPSTTFTAAATTSTDDQGRYRFTQQPRVSTTYRVIAGTQPPASAPDLRVGVRPVVGLTAGDSTPSRGQRVRLAGTVRPAHDGRTVSIQRKRSDGAFTTIARTRLLDAGSRRSRYSRRVAVRRTGTYRVVIAGHDDHVRGVSRERTLTVR